MKCIVYKGREGFIDRVSEEVAEEKVSKGLASYTNKQAWKTYKKSLNNAKVAS